MENNNSQITSSDKGNLVLSAVDIVKTFGPTKAINHVDFDLKKGEIVGLVGANGAGKSTLIKVLSGLLEPDTGSLSVDQKQIDFNSYSTIQAREYGIRVVHQELSLCKNLTVYENFYVEQSQALNKGFGWRKKAMELAKSALDEVFPENGINVRAPLGDLSIAHQQMVEISRATLDSRLKILVLDEPTSSLSFNQTEQLQEYLLRKSKEGLSVIYISHRLKEIMLLSDRVFMMQNGRCIFNGDTSEISEQDMIFMMGNSMTGAGTDAAEALQNAKTAADYGEIQRNESVKVKLNSFSNHDLKDISLNVCGGQIVGITGLDGNGQLELLKAIYDSRLKKHKSGNIDITGGVAYVAGDRKKEGIFPMWSIRDNMIITRITEGKLFKFMQTADSDKIIDPVYKELAIKAESRDALITSLSGGNQQKVLIARALCSRADIILLDDPTRGVDIATKYQLYEIFYSAALQGKIVIWRTSDDAELEYCTDLVVMRDGMIKGQYKYGDVTHEEILKLSFEGESKADAADAAASEKGHRKKNEKSAKQSENVIMALIAMVALYIIAAVFSPSLVKWSGIQLVISGAIPLLFAALSQTFIIGLGQINMSVGYFMGLINCMIVTLMFQNGPVGILLIIVALICYAMMGVLIHIRNVPSIIVTLGMSFVWYGLSLNLMPQPGGTSPELVTAIFGFKIGIVRGSLIITAACIAIAVLIYKSRYGTILRGFGNNEQTMKNSGWSRLKAYFLSYLISGIFLVIGGLILSAATGAGDASACDSYTILSVASVIIGGGYFAGGRVNHLGSIVGAIILTLISILLGLLGVSTDFTAAVQGIVLLLILSLRLARKEVAA